MALSEHEQRVLDELERGLYADDEGLARRMQKAAVATPDRRRQSKAARRIAGAAIALAGLGVLLVGAIIHYTWMGVGGFLVTLAGLVIATSGGGATDGPGSQGQGTKREPRAGHGQSNGLGKTEGVKKAGKSVGEFFEERWNRRINGD